MYPDATITYLIDKTNNWLLKEWKLDENISRGIRTLESELSQASAFIRDMDDRRKQDNQLQTYIQQIRDVASDMEIVLEMYEYRNAQKNAPRYAVTTRIGRHNIANSMEEVLSKLEKIKNSKPSYPHSASTSSNHGAANASTFVPEVEILGVEEPMKELLTWVHDDERTYKVMFVVGMGGSGKTALVKHVYQQLDTNFDCRFWLTVSKFQNGQELLSCMINKLCNPTGQSPIPYHTHGDPETKLNHNLQDKKYLIVLDDLWNREIWESVMCALPRGNHSRVIITTRRGDIASLCRENSVDVYKVQMLPIEKARDLFYRKAFSGTDPSELGLDKPSKELLKECEGLPLGIIEIGKLLSSKGKSKSELKKLHGSLQGEMASPSLSNIKQVLLLSYNELPHHLKSCFLYMSMFPAYYSVKRRMLIRLWIAEGFIEGVDGKTLEDIGEDCLEELMERNLIQASELYTDGRARTCRVHNLMHKVALSKSVDENFQAVNDSKKIRRLAIHDDKISKPDKKLNKYARTIWIRSGGNLNIPAGMISSMKLLKILHLDHANVDALPSGIEKLLLLKYLSLCQTRIKLIPETIGRLQHLETLNLKETFVTTLPKASEKLENLRYLLVSSIASNEERVQGFNAPAGISKLTNLQKLSFVRADTRNMLIFQDLQKLTQLRKLGIIDVPSTSGQDLCRTIQMLTDLRSLNLTSLHRNEVLSIQEINNPPPLLAHLYLKGSLETMPGWISKLHDLVRIRLQWSKLTVTRQSDPITILGKLPNLLELQLLDAYTGDQLEFFAGTFSKLKILELEQLKELKTIIIERWALPCLQKLIINKCPKLIQIPIGIEHTTELKVLHLSYLSPFFVEPITILGELPNLLELQLLDAYTGDQLEFDAGTFSKLKILELEQLKELKMIIIERRALPCLQKLIINKCPKLMQIPIGIEHTTELKELHLSDVSPDFEEPLRINGQLIKNICSGHHQNCSQWAREEL